MFGATLTLLTTLMHLYVFARASTLPPMRGARPRLWLWGAGALPFGVFLLERTVMHDGMGPVALWAETVGMSWMAALFLTASAMAAVDLATGFGLWARRALPAARGAALAAGGVLSLAALVQGYRAPAVVSHEVRLAGLPAALDGTVLVVLSDTHLGAQLGPRWFEGRVDQVAALDPDAVLLVGDFFENHGGPEAPLRLPLSRLRPPLGVWAVSGNHDYPGRGRGARMLGEAGVPLLQDRWVELAPGLVLAGVDDLTRRRRRGEDAGAVGRALEGRPPGGVVLLSHTPWRVEEAAAAGAGLMLAGHTHGGQIWPFGSIVRLRYPRVAGRYEVSGMTLLVSRGAGTWGPPMRLWHRGEILRVVLRPG